jgi:hypothetical protein
MNTPASARSAGVIDLEVLTAFVAAREKKPRAALFALQSVAQCLLPDERINICFRYLTPQRETVEVWYSAEKARAYYRNLMKCGLGWVCPLCAQRLSEIRRSMITSALDNTRTKYLPIMVTYTARHTIHDSLSDTLKTMTSAYRRMRQQRLWRLYKDEYMVRGETRAVEITYGANGWHPHFHVILWLDIAMLKVCEREGGVFDLSMIAGPLERHLFTMWSDSLSAVGGSTQEGVGLRVSMERGDLSAYTTKYGEVLPKDTSKWTLAHELTKGSSKKLHIGGRTVWDLLLEFYAGSAQSGRLFQEYHKATRGMSQLQFTPGLKHELGIMDIDDSQVLDDEMTEAEIMLLSIPREQWRLILARGAQGILLDIASQGSTDALRHFLAKLT